MANSKTISTDEWKWKVEGAARTLTEAEEIRMNAKLHKAAKAHLDMQAKAIDKARGAKADMGTALMNK